MYYFIKGLNVFQHRLLDDMIKKDSVPTTSFNGAEFKAKSDRYIDNKDIVIRFCNLTRKDYQIVSDITQVYENELLCGFC